MAKAPLQQQQQQAKKLVMNKNSTNATFAATTTKNVYEQNKITRSREEKGQKSGMCVCMEIQRKSNIFPLPIIILPSSNNQQNMKNNTSLLPPYSA